MGRITRIAAAALATASVGLVGAQTGAFASQQTDTCTHGIAFDSSSHPKVVYTGSYTIDGQHVHIYRHHTLTGIGNHTRERNC